MPDDSRFGIFWMDGRSLAAAFDMEGGFNHLAADAAAGRVRRRTSSRASIGCWRRYGGLGAIPRALQTSHWFLDNELSQLQSVGLILPIVFLLVAAFLLNVVLTRIVSVQREQIAALKALGYTNRELAWHYSKLSLVDRRGGRGDRHGGRLVARLRHDVDLQRLLPVPDAALPAAARAWSLGGVLVSFVAAVLGALNAVRMACGAAAGRSDAPGGAARATAAAGSSAPASRAGCRRPCA